MERIIFCIDVRSFYASVECVDRGLNPNTTPLVVLDKERGPGSICLAVSPYLKKLGIPSRIRRYDLPHLPNIIYARPRMSRYIDVSAKIVATYLDFVAPDDLHVYSIDESFLDVTHYQKLYKCSPIELAKKIKQEIYNRFSLSLSIGIGPNLLLSKIAMDIEAKKKNDGIAYWTKEDIETKLYPITPLSDFFGIGKRMEKKLNALGLYKIGDIANYPREKLVNYFGVIGAELYDHSHGIDLSRIQEPYKISEKSISSSQIFFRDYNYTEINLILMETLDDLLYRLDKRNALCKTIALSIGYKNSLLPNFHKQGSFIHPTASFQEIYSVLISFFSLASSKYPIRSMGIRLSGLIPENAVPLDLFYSPDEIAKERTLRRVTSKIKEKYGANAILRASSLLSHSTIKERHNLIGGHKK